ncbi:isochorismate synthase [Mycobacteroides sp. LB1]|uniref:isochorismate synthase n=1 Tax=Mycobacteroides sp. LB1 TaxID=2750814 RepID=UPI0015DF946A|nr:isochorismate synthase [Mycobacteroides sp. LB1]
MTATGIPAHPHFVMSRAADALYAYGHETVYNDIATAAEALRAGRHQMLVGALPFDTSKPAALTVPVTVRRGQPQEFYGTMPNIVVKQQIPEPAEHLRRVTEAIEVLRDTNSGLSKVVLARVLELQADAPVDALVLTHRLIRNDPDANSFCVDLSPAGDRFRDRTLVGCSPELLVERRGDMVICHPFAGSAPRSKDPSLDRRTAEDLAGSHKDRHEHSVVIDQLREDLASLCVDVQVPPEPTLSSTAALWHLSTSISARLRQSSTTALDLALALHPTPAVCGTPTESAADLIARIEGERGFYAGAAGWCDSYGDGRWVVSIRCAELSADETFLRAYAGGGLVAESDPQDELSETTVKFRTILAGLGAEIE